MNPTLDKPPFPDDPAQAAVEYLRDHWAVLFVIVFAILALVTPARREREVEDAFPFDDEPLDDEDREAIADARAGRGSYIPLDEYVERRYRAS
jgi:hypothetical protein